MSAWKAGDKALCVDDSWSPQEAKTPGGWVKRGTVYLVTDCYVHFSGKLALSIAGVPAILPSGSDGWRESRFRKLVPLSERSERTQTELHPHAGFFAQPNEPRQLKEL